MIAIPDVDASMDELAAFWIEHFEELKALDTFLYRAKRRLKEAIADQGPFAGADGRLLQIIPDGWEWDEAGVAAVMPSLIASAEVTFAGKLAEIERVLSMVTEEFPLMGFEVGRKIDKVAANRVVRQPGEAAAKLAECRTPKGRLGVSG